jgi:hypothetical protein
VSVRVAALAVLGLGGAALAGLAARGVAADLATSRDLHAQRYAGSAECRRCHPSHAESWGRTFHRTMTQDASGALGAFDGRALEHGGWTAFMERDPDGAPVVRIERDGEPVARHRVERTVGSRRYQQYLAREGATWWRLPVAWDVEEQRFFHMNEAFLYPDPPGFGARTIERSDYERHVVRWNDNCVFCHNVAPDPGRDPATGAFDTQVAELGIACEACHGPGAEHAAANASPLRRYAIHASGAPDPTIANPARLDPARSADVCGRCHGQRITDDVGAFLEHGDPFVPGDDLALYSSPLWRDTTLDGREGVFAARFWGDGTARLSAYEYQGLLQSRCATEGSLTCTDCHGMHGGDPRGQIRPHLAGDAMCAGACHARLADPEIAREHAAHDGVACVDCHMPRIVYGIRSVLRSHRIDSPRPAASALAGRPDACALCHLEESPAWAEREVARRTRRAPIDAPDVPVMLALGIGGDPIERAVAAAALGRTSTPERRGILLATMEHDPYPAVRALAWRSLRAISGLERDAFDAADPPARRAEAVRALRARAAPVVDPDPALASSLRAEARQVAIEIGE